MTMTDPNVRPYTSGDAERCCEVINAALIEVS